MKATIWALTALCLASNALVGCGYEVTQKKSKDANRNSNEAVVQKPADLEPTKAPTPSVTPNAVVTKPPTDPSVNASSSNVPPKIQATPSDSTAAFSEDGWYISDCVTDPQDAKYSKQFRLLKNGVRFNYVVTTFEGAECVQNSKLLELVYSGSLDFSFSNQYLYVGQVDFISAQAISSITSSALNIINACGINTWHSHQIFNITNSPCQNTSKTFKAYDVGGIFNFNVSEQQAFVGSISFNKE